MEVSVCVVVCDPSDWSVVVVVLTSLLFSPVLSSVLVSVRVLVRAVGCVPPHAATRAAAIAKLSTLSVLDMAATIARSRPHLELPANRSSDELAASGQPLLGDAKTARARERCRTSSLRG